MKFTLNIKAHSNHLIAQLKTESEETLELRSQNYAGESDVKGFREALHNFYLDIGRALQNKQFPLHTPQFKSRNDGRAEYMGYPEAHETIFANPQ